MKKRIISLLLFICALIFSVGTLTGCKGDKEPKTPEKLATPVVTLSGAVASWEQNLNADKFEISISGNLSYVENTVTSKTLENNQTFKIRAVGDGVNYSTSDWSNTVTYTQGGGNENPQPSKLSTPTVSISNSGLASWSAVANASGYAYKIDGGNQTSITQTSVQLVNGQSISVKAVGDGVNYADSDFSASKTYTQTSTTPTEAPVYLGITASNTEPKNNEIPPEFQSYSLDLTQYTTLSDAINEYFKNGDNAMGETAPAESDYLIYSQIGHTAYIQIWLENPDQNTILSLKLNGNKYQSGGALQSFFIQNGNTYLNCVYVAVEIPANSYTEIEYTVTEIEYVEGANISQDGKEVMIDENNDTVVIGLPYENALPQITDGDEPQVTSSSLTLNLNATNTQNFADFTGGWLRAIIYSSNYQGYSIIAQQKLTGAQNTITFENLSAQSYYYVAVLAYADMHDGDGVCAHALYDYFFSTPQAVQVEVEGQTLKNSQTGKYYANLNIQATLNDNSFSFSRIEISEGHYEFDANNIVYSGEFNGSLDVSQNILNEKNYVVRVYYKNSAQTEQYVDSIAYLDSLYIPSFSHTFSYGLINDVVVGFKLSQNEWDRSNFDNLTLKIYDEYSKEYLAENAVYLIENPNAIAELENAWQSMDRSDERFHDTYDRWYKLDQTQNRIDEYWPQVEESEWREYANGSKYLYEITFGESDDFFIGANDTYYVILRDYTLKKVSSSSVAYTLVADVDFNNGEPIESEKQILYGFIEVRPAITESDYLFEEEYYLDENGVVYLEVKSRNNLGDESYRNLGYVNQIVLADGYEILFVLWEQEQPNDSIDEDAWLASVKNALILGEDHTSVFPLGELEPISFDIDDVDIPSYVVGHFDIRFTYKMYGKTYTQEEPYDWDGSTIAYTVVGQLPKASININTKPVEDYGAYEVIIPESVENGRWNYYSFEVKDGDGSLVGTYNQDNRIERLSANYSIRIKLDANPYIDYYTEGEWSDWFVCEKGKLYTPSEFTQSYDEEGVTVEWQGVGYAENYVYVINDGEEKQTSGPSVSALKNGDVIKVKAVPFSDTSFAESYYSVGYTITDNRTQLATPKNARFEPKVLVWDAVDGADYYLVAYIQSGEPRTSQVDSTEFYNAKIGTTYSIRAYSENVENYRASEWSAGVIYTVTLENPSFNQIRSGRVHWNSVEYAEGYNYKIGENGTVASTERCFISLSEIPVGEKLYVQAYATGCENTDWVMIYHNVTKLETPFVTLSGGTASWIEIENATGYVYKINDGVEQSTTQVSVSGLVGGDRIVVCATSTQNGYVDSDWSEERTQLHTMSAPVLDTSSFASQGTISWGAVEGATDYEYDLDGVVNTVRGTSVSNIKYGQKFKVRATCDNGEFEQYGKWSEIVVREDTREQLATPVIAYDPEIGLTVVADDPRNVSYEVKFGQNGYYSMTVDSSSSGGTQVLTDSFIFPDDDHTVYVRAFTRDGSYRESEWATITITF